MAHNMQKILNHLRIETNNQKLNDMYLPISISNAQLHNEVLSNQTYNYYPLAPIHVLSPPISS